MAGNVWQWCNDWYGAYGSGAQTNPTGPSIGTYRVIRGGGYSSNATYLRSGFRNYGSTAPSTRSSAFGFRIACRP